MERVRLGRRSENEKLRFHSCNREALTTHFTTPEDVITKKCITPDKLCNLNKSGVTAKRDAHKTVRPKHSVCLPTFRNVDRVTVVPVVISNSKTSNQPFTL